MKTSFKNSFVHCIDKLDIMKKIFLFLLLVPMVSFGQTADDLNTSGNTKMNLKDYYGAINDYSRAIELKPDNVYAYYFNRGNAKKNLKDYYGAINDYSKSIELAPDYPMAYNNRAYAKDQLKDHYGAINDFSKAIELNPDFAMAYNNRGFAKYNLNDIDGACKDVRIAVSLGYVDSQNFIGDVCN